MIDLIMLTNTADKAIFDMTCGALESLYLSENDIEFNVILVESNPSAPYRFGDFFPLTMIQYEGEKFNYNAALNQAFNHLSSDSKFVVIANNDLVFHSHWAYILTKEMEKHKLHVGSPFAPGWEPHEENFGDYADVFLGTRTSFEVAGWCVCLRRDVLEAIRPFDERFCFEFQDVDMVDKLLNMGYNSIGLVRHSRVRHLLNQSHRLIAEQDRSNMIEGARHTYMQKQNEYL